jgi:hypothetical protein
MECPWEVVRAAAGLPAARPTALTPAHLHEWPLPAAGPKRLRKIARLAVLVGAALALARGRFSSLRGDVVLPLMREWSPEWGSYLDEVEERYVRPRSDEAAARELDAFTKRTVEWMEWVDGEVARELG